MVCLSFVSYLSHTSSLTLSGSLAPAPSISPAEINPPPFLSIALFLSFSLSQACACLLKLALRLEELSSHGSALGSDPESRQMSPRKSSAWKRIDLGVHQDYFLPFCFFFFLLSSYQKFLQNFILHPFIGESTVVITAFRRCSLLNGNKPPEDRFSTVFFLPHSKEFIFSFSYVSTTGSYR